jgi:hypothetical protein
MASSDAGKPSENEGAGYCSAFTHHRAAIGGNYDFGDDAETAGYGFASTLGRGGP